MRTVAEEQHRRIGQVHPHHRFADGELRQLGAHLGDDDRGGAVRRALAGIVLLIHRSENEGHRHLAALGRGARPAMIFVQPALVASQLFREALGGRIEGQVMVARRGVAVDDDAAPDM